MKTFSSLGILHFFLSIIWNVILIIFIEIFQIIFILPIQFTLTRYLGYLITSSSSFQRKILSLSSSLTTCRFCYRNVGISNKSSQQTITNHADNNWKFICEAIICFAFTHKRSAFDWLLRVIPPSNFFVSVWAKVNIFTFSYSITTS